MRAISRSVSATHCSNCRTRSCSGGTSAAGDRGASRSARARSSRRAPAGASSRRESAAGAAVARSIHRDAGAKALDRIAHEHQHARLRGGSPESTDRWRNAGSTLRPAFPAAGRSTSRTGGVPVVGVVPVPFEEVQLLVLGVDDAGVGRDQLVPPGRPRLLHADADEVGRAVGPAGRTFRHRCRRARSPGKAPSPSTPHVYRCAESTDVGSRPMKVDTGIMAGALDEIAVRARELEDLGYDGLITAETGSDPFLPLVIAAEHTDRIELGTGIAVAFARTPMLTAYTANDLQRHSKGRFFLGLGSQIKPHIERRFSMPWSHPAARMREYILAMRAIWASWIGRIQARFPRRLLHAHPDDAVLQPGPEPVRTAEGVPRGGRRVDDRSRGRSRRRRDHPRLHDRALREGGDAPGDRAGSGEGRPFARRLRDLRSAVRRHRNDRGGVRDGQAGGAAAGRVLRIDARLPAGARAPRLGRAPARAQPPVEAGRVGEDGRADRRRRAERVRGRCRARPHRPRAHSRYAGVVDRCSFYAPYRVGPGAVGRGDRRA